MHWARRNGILISNEVAPPLNISAPRSVITRALIDISFFLRFDDNVCQFYSSSPEPMPKALELIWSTTGSIASCFHWLRLEELTNFFLWLQFVRTIPNGVADIYCWRSHTIGSICYTICICIQTYNQHISHACIIFALQMFSIKWIMWLSDSSTEPYFQWKYAATI